MAGIPNKIFEIDKGIDQTFQAQFVVASGAAATIARGTPTKSTESDGTATGALIPMVDGDGLVTAERFGGIAKSTSTDTAAAAGTVDVWLPVPGLVYRGFAKSSAAADTQSEINALMRKRVLFDLTSSDWTVDTAATDALVNCVVIVGGIPASSSILFMYASKGTILNTATSM